MGVYGFLPLGPSCSSPLGRGCSCSFSPSHSSLLLRPLGVCCSIPRENLVLSLLSLGRGFVGPYSNPLRWSSEGNSDPPFLPVMFPIGRKYRWHARTLHVATMIMHHLPPLAGCEPTMEMALSPGGCVPSTQTRVPIMGVVHICPVPSLQLEIITTRSPP